LLFVSGEESLQKGLEAMAALPSRIPQYMVSFDDLATPVEGVLGWSDFLALGADETPIEKFRESAMQAEPEDLATMIYTSGTTGEPKGVMLTHGNMFSNVSACSPALPCGPTDSTLSFLPLSHVFQRMVDYLFFSKGVVIVHGDIHNVAEELRRVRPTVVVSVPRLYEKVYQKVVDASGLKGKLVAWAATVARKRSMLLEAGTRPSLGFGLQIAVADRLVFSKLRAAVGGRLRYFISGGAPLSKPINRFFHGAGVKILEGYGLTETSPVTNVNSPEFFRIGTVGKPVPGTEIKLEEDGEILIRGPQVMKGYWGRPEQTAEVLGEDGWFRTGDIGVLSDDGYLSITDRKKALLKTAGGKYIAPQPIENALKSNPFIDQALVIGDRRPFCAVLIVPAFERLAAWAAETGVGLSVAAELVADPRVHKLMEEQVFDELRDLARFEMPKKIGLLVEPFSIEQGTLTPTQKVRRMEVLKSYPELADLFYRPESREQTVFFVSA